MVRKGKRLTACTLALAMTATSFAMPMAKQDVEAAYTKGNAPYINTWLTAGPSDTSVTDKIYGDAQSPVERPSDGNWARVAKVSATSTWQNGPWDYPAKDPSAKNNVDKAVDGDKNTCWLSQMHDKEGAPKDWPAWDPKPTYYLEWTTPIKVKSVEFFNRYDANWGDQAISQINEVKVSLKDAAGTVLAEQTVTDINHKGETPGVATFDKAIENVSKVELLIVHDGVKELRNVGLGFSEVNVFDGDGEEAVVEGEKLEIVSTEASTTLNGSDKACAIDGDMETAWKSDTRQGIVWDDKLTMMLNLKETSQITNIKINGFEKDNQQIGAVYTLLNEDGDVVKTLTQNDIIQDDFVSSSFANAYNVKTVEVKLKEQGGAPNHLGIREIEVYGVPGKVDVPEEPESDIKITPNLGEEFGDASWEYFDDRVFNRNLDDWQDLYGYYTVKKGIPTKDKYVYAHTYVYSPKEQSVDLRMVTSGLHKVYVNDKLVHENESAVESTNKDQYKKSIKLKEGWNKILIEVQHTRTHYVGFYARLCDKDGNEVEGLEYSVTGDQAEKLSIVTQGLDIDKASFEERNKDIPSNMYPENELPYGYVQWPYVWNKPLHRSDSWAPQASRFRFEAAGGNPDYTWEIVEGKLPDGLKMDKEGVIDGYCEKIGEYPFTVQVTDKDGNKAVKETKIVVKERPNKWFEEGKMSALSHDTGAYSQFYDENFSFDLWAERAKKAGMTMLSTEALQGVYYWPGPGATNANLQHPYTLDENGKPKDMVKLAKEAAERHGLRFGVYYASEGSNRLPNGHTNNSSGFVMNVEDLMKRYDPAYLFFDGGPQGKGNVDAMWSAVRAYNDYALVQANDQYEAGDNDLTILETEYTGKMPYVHGGYWEQAMWNENKYTVEEAWTHPFFKEIGVWSQYAGGHMRDDWRLFAEYIIYSIGHGIVPNYDQMIVNTRGVNWSGINFAAGVKDEYYNLPLNAQEMIDMRDKVNAWMANAGGPDLHESLFGTMPYYFDTYEKQSGWHENSEKEPFLTAKYGEGPDWGYSVARDQYVYMHMQENTMGAGRAKKGFTGQDSIEVGPFDYKVTKVEWLNEGKELGFTPFEKDGKSYIRIDTSSVKADPVDTIIKITTDNPKRDFELTGVKLFADQSGADALSLRAEAYMKDFTNVFAPAKLTYTSSDEGVAKVDKDGVVTPVGNGDATIKVVADYEGKTAEDTYAVTVKDGKVYVAEELISVVMRTDGKEAFDKVSTNKNLPITFEARTQKGGGVNLLDYDNVTWHYATCDGQRDGHLEEADGYWHANQEVESLDILKIENNEVVFNGLVSKEENVAIWADVTVDGKTYTTNKNYLRIAPSYVLSEGVVPEVSSNDKTAKEVTDGILNSADGGNTSKWTPAKDDKTPTMTFELDQAYAIDGVRLYFNNKDRYYKNRPQSVKVEVSSDNKEWKTVVESGEVPGENTPYFYEDDKYTYPVNQTAKYVRVSFPGGAAENVMDILETQILGADHSNELDRIEVEKTVLDDKTSMELDVTGYTGKNDPVDLSKGRVEITSANEEVAVVEGNTVKAVAPGTAKITVKAIVGGFSATEEFYVKVDENGQISTMDYLKSIEVSMDSNVLDNGDNKSIDVSMSGKLNTGADADLTNAQVSCEFSNDTPVYQDGKITVNGEIAENEIATAKFTVTLDGVTLESQTYDMILAAKYFAPGKIEAEDGIIQGEKVKEEAGDGGIALGYIKEGDVYTYIINAEEAGTYEVYYRVVAEQMDKRMQCYVNGELQGGARFEEAGNWVDFSTQKQDETIKLNKGVNVITLKPIGVGYLFNFNWFELVKAKDVAHKITVQDGMKHGIVVVDKETALPGEKVTITVTPDKGYALKDGTLKVNDGAVKVSDNTFVMPNEDVVITAEFEAVAQPPVVHKEILQKTYDYALTLNTDGVTDSAKAVFEKAMVEAKAVLDKEDATQEEVNTAWNNLLDGIWGLGIVQGDKTNLKLLIDRANAMMKEKDRYVEKNWPWLEEALTEAEAVMKDGNALEEDVQPAAEKLLNAILMQRYKANKDNLKDLIDKANGLDLSKYTEKSVKALKKALAKANAIYADDSLSTDDQKKVDKAADELAAAINGLKLVSDDGNNGDGNVPGNGGNGNNGGTQSDGDKDAKKDAPKTGDTMNVALWMLMAGAAGAAGVESKRRKRS